MWKPTAAAVAVLVFACGPRTGVVETDAGAGAGADAGPGGPSEFTDAAPARACTAVDILFVVDDSGSMRQERDNLRANFPGFVAALDGFRNVDGAPIDYRVAVTSTTPDYDYIDRRPILGDVPVAVDGADGAFQQGCGMTRPWLERGDPGLGDAFSCIADLPAAAGVLEMPLRATELAFTRRVTDGANAGFLREDALLAVVVLTDEDDCSRADTGFVLEGGSDRCTDPDWPQLEPVDHYLSFLDNLKSGRGRWALAVLGGVCADDTHDARPAVRLQDMVSRTGEAAVFQSICAGGDLTAPLAQALATFEEACDALPPVL